MGAGALEAERVSRAALPVIDVSGLEGGSRLARQQVAAALRTACLDKGFFYIVGHDVPPPLMAQAFVEAKRLFDLPEADKLALNKAASPANRGYEPLRGQTLQAGGAADLKEGFYLGPELAADDPRVLAGKFNHGPNQWPAALPAFRETMEAYGAALLRLADRLAGALAVSLGLEESAFDGLRREPLTVLRLLHYPPQPPRGEAGMGAGAHTDFGALTLLLQDDNGGLQVFDPANGGWIHAAPVPGAFVVNLGDLVARWTNDRYRSTRHRVVNASGRERYSIPFFYSGNPDFEVACLGTCLRPGEVAHYPPTTVEGHLREMYGRTYG